MRCVDDWREGVGEDWAHCFMWWKLGRKAATLGWWGELTGGGGKMAGERLCSFGRLTGRRCNCWRVRGRHGRRERDGKEHLEKWEVQKGYAWDVGEEKVRETGTECKERKELRWRYEGCTGVRRSGEGIRKQQANEVREGLTLKNRNSAKRGVAREGPRAWKSPMAGRMGWWLEGRVGTLWKKLGELTGDDGTLKGMLEGNEGSKPDLTREWGYAPLSIYANNTRDVYLYIYSVSAYMG